jgi:hypothetical protein
MTTDLYLKPNFTSGIIGTNVDSNLNKTRQLVVNLTLENLMNRQLRDTRTTLAMRCLLQKAVDMSVPN